YVRDILRAPQRVSPPFTRYHKAGLTQRTDAVVVVRLEPVFERQRLYAERRGDGDALRVDRAQQIGDQRGDALAIEFEISAMIDVAGVGDAISDVQHCVHVLKAG